MQKDLLDESGYAHSFLVSVIGAALTPVGGVYVFARAAPIQWEFVFVGETDDLQRDLSSHLLDHPHSACLRRYGATHILTRVMASQVERVALTEALRRRYASPCADSARR